MSSGLAGTYHSSLLGVYVMDEDDYGKNVSQFNRRVFRHVDTNDNWLYYWDWGPNAGKICLTYVCVPLVWKSTKSS